MWVCRVLLVFLFFVIGCSNQSSKENDVPVNSDWADFPDPVYDCPPPIGTEARGAPLAPIADPGEPVEMTFSVSIDLNHTGFDTEHLQPLTGIAGRFCI